MSKHHNSFDEAVLERLERHPPRALIKYLRDQTHVYPRGSVCRNRLETTIRELEQHLSEDARRKREHG